MREVPEIATGPRGPENILSRKEALLQAGLGAQPESKTGSGPAALRELPPGTVEFFSEFPRLIVQLTSPADMRDPVTGVRLNARPVKLVFTHGRAVTKDVQIIHRIKGCPAECGKHLAPDGERCGPHPNFNVTFFDAQEMQQKARKRAVDQAVEVATRAAEEDPEVAAALLERLTAKTVELPKKTGKAAEKPASTPAASSQSES